MVTAVCYTRSRLELSIPVIMSELQLSLRGSEVLRETLNGEL